MHSRQKANNPNENDYVVDGNDGDGAVAITELVGVAWAPII